MDNNEHSTNLAEVGTDYISRQAAIDALDTGLWGVEWDKALATAILKDLPSVQPKPKPECSCEQIKWERDMAIAQLNELGYGLGEKPRTGQR